MLKPFCDFCGVELNLATKVHFVRIDEVRSVRVDFFHQKSSDPSHICDNCRVIQLADALRTITPEHLKDEGVFGVAKAMQEAVSED